MPWFYYVGGFLARMLLALLTRWQVNGRENIPSEGPLLVVANHLHAFDPVVVALSLNRKVIFMAKEELFRCRLRAYILRGFGSFPVHRGRLDMKALRLANQLLAQGLALAIFPEGKRSFNGQLQPALPGSALIAARNGAPILPIGITGTENAGGGIAWLLRRPRITVNIGRTFFLPPAGSRLTKAELAERAQLITSHIAQLLPEDYHGDCKP